PAAAPGIAEQEWDSTGSSTTCRAPVVCTGAGNTLAWDVHLPLENGPGAMSREHPAAGPEREQMSSVTKIKDEYPPDFCTLLEVTYGKGFMSEGGAEAVDAMFRDLVLEKKNVLEIGSGLGGAAHHLVKNHNAIVTGLEINQPMVDEANRRVPHDLRARLGFRYYNDISRLPFEDRSFDLVFSKGVLLHLDVAEKGTLFSEIYRVVRPGGTFVINDWLSPSHGCWGAQMQEMIDEDALSIVANTENDYKEVIRKTGFVLDRIDAEDKVYYRYNKTLEEHLKRPDVQTQLLPLFTREKIETEARMYGLIAKSIAQGEMLVRRILCHRPV
ncbi:MAG: methyltransferase domain-containing protein, partial [Methanoregula sp.]|nr:methyltransferase domain-containing protein [Methanoregula sp.]